MYVYTGIIRICICISMCVCVYTHAHTHTHTNTRTHTHAHPPSQVRVAHKVSVIGIVSNASSGDLLVGAVGTPYPAGLIISTVSRKSVPVSGFQYPYRCRTSIYPRDSSPSECGPVRLCARRVASRRDAPNVRVCVCLSVCASQGASAARSPWCSRARPTSARRTPARTRAPPSSRCCRGGRPSSRSRRCGSPSSCAESP